MFYFHRKRRYTVSCISTVLPHIQCEFFFIDIFAIAVLTFYFSDTGTAMFSDPTLVCEGIMVASCVDVEVCLLTP